MEITMDELIVRFRRLQDGHRVDSGYNRGVSDCIRVLLEIGENEGCECWCDRQQEVGNADRRVSEISSFKAFNRLPLQFTTNQFIVAKIEP